MSDKWFCQIGIGVYAECVKLLQQGWYGVLVDADPMTFAKMYSHLESELATPLFQRLTFINTAITGKDELIEFASYPFDRAGDIEEWSHGSSASFLDKFDRPSSARFVGHGTSLDTLVRHIGNHIDFLMMDIAGEEVDVLKHYSFADPPSVIQVEYHWGNEREVRPILNASDYLSVASLDDGKGIQERWHHSSCVALPPEIATLWGYPWSDNVRYEVAQNIKKGKFPNYETQV